MIPREPVTRLPSPIADDADVSSLRSAVKTLSAQAAEAVDSVRRAFTAGTAPVQTVSSGSAADYVTRFGKGGTPAQIITSTARFGLTTAVGGTKVTPPKPEIDHVSIESSRTKGIGDSYFARITVSIAKDDLARVSVVRLLRADGDRVDVPVPTVTALEQTPIGGTRKSTDPIGSPAIRSSFMGAGNKLSLFVRDDGFSPARSVVSSGTLRPVPAPINTNRMGTEAGLLSISNADPSVLKSVSYYLSQRSQAVPVPPSVPLTVGKRQGINVLAGSSVSSSPQIAVEVGNSQNFREISRVPTVPNVEVGGYVELEFIDGSVIYGRSYTYYAVCQSESGMDGSRSRLVRVDVARMAPPAMPDALYGVVAGRPRFSVRCSGTFVDRVEVFRRGGQRPELVRLIGSNRSIVTTVAPDETDSGFTHIGDLPAGADRSITFVDRDVTPGQTLDYRLYSVDAYGTKCQTPFSCSIFLPDHGRRIPLGLPNITAEQGTSPKQVIVSVSCDDPRVQSFVIARREIGNRENGFHQPSQPDKFTGGRTDPVRAGSRVGPTLQWSKKAWSGIYTAVSGVAKLFDTAVNYDRTYQYSVIGIDVRGNETSRIISPPLRVSVKPVADPPVAVTGTVLTDQSGAPTAVRISWDHGTSDFSPNELVGDQDVLAATSVRTVYQVERRALGRTVWDVMPAVTGNFFDDRVSGEQAPKFRPPYAVVGREYEYRVIAMQSGGFVSPHTDPVGIAVVPTITSPGVIWVRTTGMAVKPTHVVVSWNYDGTFVDGWDIERAVTNKIFGAKIVSMDSVEARSLAYSPVAQVKRESSRAAGVMTGRTIDRTVFVGNRFYIDQDADPANSYFYRIRAVDVVGRTSDWTYAGIMLTDSPHDRKFYSSLSDREKVAMANNPRPVSKWRNR